MKHSFVVREFARIGAGRPEQLSFDHAVVAESAFEWLCQESARLRKSGAPLVHVEGRSWLRLDNYVGVLETPCGTRLEILPKLVDSSSDIGAARILLRRMLMAVFSLPWRESALADIQVFNGPLTEWVMREFLRHLDRLIKRGIRFDYRTQRDRQRFLRGRLLVGEQARQPPGRAHLFAIEHDVFEPDRPENRLLRSALGRVCQMARDPDNWRLSHELVNFLAEIPVSVDIDGDFLRWRDERLMAHYNDVRPWCELILAGQNPKALAGEWRGASLLFPMESLFERYVEVKLRSQVSAAARVLRTPSREYLCEHKGSKWFNLQPDLLVRTEMSQWVLDAKWKRLDEARGSPGEKYDLSQSDIYQMFAYGHKYLAGKGDLALIYPASATFSQPLPAFGLAEGLRLWVLPFNLESGRVIGLDLAGIPQAAVTVKTPA